MDNTISVDEPRLMDEVRWGLLQRKLQERSVLQAFKLFRSNGIEPILIKGLAAAQYYPPSRPRLSMDMDLAVGAHDFDRANDLSRSESARGLAIDIHRELRHLDTVEWGDLYTNSRLLSLDGDTIRVLRPEDHLRVLCVHWLTDGGSSKDRLWDIYYMIENRPSDFDWDRFLKPISRRRQRWMACAVGLAGLYLGLDIENTPLKGADRDLPLWLRRSVEREWTRDTPLKPLEICLNDPKMFMTQLRMRLRPNQIWATIQMEGSIDSKTRFFYQIGSFLKRIMPSYRRVSRTLTRKLK